MRRSRACAPVLLVGLVVVAVPAQVRGQIWSADAAAGRVVYDPISANVGTNNVMGTLRYDAARGAWVYGTAAAPLRDGDPGWAAFGTGGRFLPADAARRRASFGAEVGAHGYVFRDAIADQTGRGATVEAMPFVHLAAGAGDIEVRGGWRGHTLTFAGVSDNRGVFETGVRAGYGQLVRVEGDVRLWHASEGTYPFVGGSLVYGGSPLQAWARLGKGLDTALDEVAWGLGAQVALGDQHMLWARVGQEAPDPLYWNATRRTWTVGVTRRLGRPTPVRLAVPRVDDRGVVIRLPASAAPGEALFLAGDFNDWRAIPMRREGRDWVIRVPLAAGVYHYAFRSADGEWFVPASMAGRRDDGMGGHVAMLVVG